MVLPPDTLLPASMKQHLVAKGPTLFMKIKSYPHAFFTKLTGLDPTNENYAKMEAGLVDALVQAKKENAAPLKPVEQETNILTLASRLEDDDL
eukprot:CAMPEP_0170509680 /NCGR_PEP_ID=MMETSP0208-20121228/65347_1 /TAXON_ID=197538 /ORGANISM="Strombidium inclinatum, Strain S3" /LENGTH=92 /DNA_ID=CAMNT_0010793063 /DNA_START=766 /DNA_END=1040 /DNA_ORIENTATION=+